MTKSKKAVTGMEWDTIGGMTSFPPLWKPEKVGEFVIGVPLEIKTNFIMQKEKGKKKLVKKAMHNIDFLLRETNSKNFFTGSKKKKTVKKADIALGDIIAIPGGSTLQGGDRLYIDKGNKAMLSNFAKACSSKELSMRIVFNGRVDNSFGNKTKVFIVQIPKGIKKK